LIQNKKEFAQYNKACGSISSLLFVGEKESVFDALASRARGSGRKDEPVAVGEFGSSDDIANLL